VAAEPIVDAVNDLADRLDVRVRVLDEPLVPALLAELRRQRPHILHVAGHGEFDDATGLARLALLEVDGTARWVTEGGLADLLVQADAVPRLVVLHACEGATVSDRASFAGMAPRLVAAGVAGVVAMQYAVTNNAAIAFTSAFYEELAAGCPADVAVQRGRWAISGALSADENARLLGIPVLYLHSRDRLLPPAGQGQEVAGRP
jgi:CHAT domain-containing protein